MTKLFQTCILLVMLTLAAGNSYGQVIYTTNGTCDPNLVGYFNTQSCWIKTGNNCSAALVPPVTGTVLCPVTVVINHPINLTTFNFGANVTVIVNSGGVWNISGNITQTQRIVSKLVIDGGQVNVGGSVVLSSGISTAKTTLRIETRNSGILNVNNAFTTGNNSLVEISGDQSGSLNTGTFNLGNLTNLNLNSGGIVNVSGNFNQVAQSVSNIVIDGGELNINGSVLLAAGSTSVSTTLRIDTKNLGLFNIGNSLNLGNNSFVEIKGDDSGSINTGFIDLGQRSRLDILAGGRLISSGNTRYNGNNARMDVYGYFKTLALDIIGGTGLQFNSLGSANVVVETDVTVGGTSAISFGGDSVVEIGGDFKISGNPTVVFGPDADVFVCGTPDPDIIDEVVGCLLPVDYVYIESVYSKVSNTNLLTWATAKEWENSGFEIERSIGTATEFEKIGEVSGMGWKESITEYKFVDALLPLTGGNIYYRLKQIDFDGSFELSKVVSIRVPGVQFTQGVWRAYPNPTDGSQFRISLLDPEQYNQEKITFRIIHPTSVSREVMVNSEIEMNEALARMIGNIPKGVFVVELRWGQKIEHIKVLRKR